jgi:hypothetical protein
MSTNYRSDIEAFISGAVAGALTAYLVASGKAQAVVQAPRAPSMFDYIVDIYSDKVVVTASDGSTTELKSIDEFNNWLKDVTDKKIRINMNMRIAGDFYLTPNEYWIFGKRIDGNIYLLDGKHTVISFAPISYIANWRKGVYYDISGSRIYILDYAEEVDISGTRDKPLRNITVVVRHSYATSLEYVEDSDMYANGYFVHSAVSVLRNVLIDAAYANFEAVTTRNREGTWLVVSHMYAGAAPLDLSNVYVAVLRLTDTWWISVSPRSTFRIYLPEIRGTNWTLYSIAQIGVDRCVERRCVLDPLPEGITYTIDVSLGELRIENNTDSAYDISIVYEILAFKYW